MKSFLIIFVFIVSSECGLLDDLVNSKEQSQGLVGLLNKKPQSASESNRTENHQGVLIKVRETLENGTKIVIDALGNVIRIHPKENSKTEGTPESTTNSSAKDNELVKKDEASEPNDPKTDLPISSTEKVKVEAPKTDENQNGTLHTEANTETKDSTTPKAVENQNKTLPTDTAAETKDGASKLNENVKNTTDTSNVDGNTAKNCTTTDGKACDYTKVRNRASFKGDECPAGKSRADDGTCVEEIK